MPLSPEPSPSKPLSPEFAADQKILDATNSMTPRSARLTTAEVSSILSQLASATQRSDHGRCRKSAVRIRALAEESDRNRSRLAISGAAGVLAASFHEIAASGGAADVLSDILSALVLVFPVDDEEVFSAIGSPKSLDAIASILQSGHPSANLNATLVLKQMVSSNKDLARAAARIDGLIEALLSRIGDPISPISPRGKRASLLAAFHLVDSSEEWTTARFIRTGVVSLVLESLVDSESETRVNEAALAALDRLCSSELGREKAYGNALTVPVLVKKMFGVSDLATELAVSSLWKLCKNSVLGKEGEIGCVVEAMQVGAFVKLLMLLQVECRESVKERATELLRFFSKHGDGLGCIDSKDFRGLHRPV